jgi:hypothetical protein
VPAFEREWAAALEESRRTLSLAALYAVIQDWQGRIAHASAIDAFVASGYDDSDAAVAHLRDEGHELHEEGSVGRIRDARAGRRP